MHPHFVFLDIESHSINAFIFQVFIVDGDTPFFAHFVDSFDDVQHLFLAFYEGAVVILEVVDKRLKFVDSLGGLIRACNVGNCLICS